MLNSLMFNKSLQFGFIGLFLCVANAWAGPSSIQGIVKDAKGQPIKGADVRVESRDGKQLLNTVKTDAKGGYISQGLPAGVYRVTLVVNAAVKASITNTKTKADQATQLNFDLKPVQATQVSAGQKKGKHKVWVPSSTGSHIGGRWVEVDDGATESGHLNVKRATGEQLRQEVLRSGGGPQTVPSGAGPSSRRFKKDIEPMDKASEVVLALNPVTFHYKSDHTATPQFGLIAEEVAKVNPDLVVRDENGEIYAVRYDQVNAMLLNEFLKERRAVQEQQKEIDALKAELKRQSEFIQKVNDKVELDKRAPHISLNDQ
jgi:Carboxypeptidase regulatory-like domain/Chaperone of endosialidase